MQWVGIGVIRVMRYPYGIGGRVNEMQVCDLFPSHLYDERIGVYIPAWNQFNQEVSQFSERILYNAQENE